MPLQAANATLLQAARGHPVLRAANATLRQATRGHPVLPVASEHPVLLATRGPPRA